jgi:hypothetical protein
VRLNDYDPMQGVSDLPLDIVCCFFEAISENKDFIYFSFVYFGYIIFYFSFTGKLWRLAELGFTGS